MLISILLICYLDKKNAKKILLFSSVQTCHYNFRMELEHWNEYYNNNKVPFNPSDLTKFVIEKIEKYDLLLISLNISKK